MNLISLLAHMMGVTIIILFVINFIGNVISFTFWNSFYSYWYITPTLDSNIVSRIAVTLTIEFIIFKYIINFQYCIADEIAY